MKKFARAIQDRPRRPDRRLPVALLSIALLLFTVPGVRAEDDLSADVIRQTIETVNTDSALGDERRSTLRSQLDTALQRLDEAQAFDTRAARYEAAAETAESDIRAFQDRLAQAQANPVEPEALIDGDASTGEIESRIDLVEAERQALADRRRELLEIFEGWPARREAIRQRLAELPALIDEQLGVVQLPADNLDQKVRRLHAWASLQALRAEQNSLEREVRNKPATLEVIAAERDWLVQALADADRKLRALNEAADASRAAITREKLASVAAIERELQHLDPALDTYLERNRELARQIEESSSVLEQARETGQHLQSQLESIEQDAALMRRRLEFAGRRETLGRYMNRRLEQLPDTQLIRKVIRARTDQIADLSLSFFDIDEELWAIKSREKYLRETFPGKVIEEAGASELVDRLVDQRLVLLEENDDSLKTLISTLVENNEKSSLLITATDDFHQFLVGNLMWVRNFQHFNPQAFYGQLHVLISPRDWVAVPLNLVNGVRQHHWSAPMLLFMVLILALRRPLRAIYQKRLDQPALLNTATLLNIFLCLLLSFLIVLPWPLLLFLAGVFLGSVQPGTVFLDAIGPALLQGSRALYCLLLARLLISPRGMGRRLLKWDSRMLAQLRRELDWVGPVIVVAAALHTFAVHVGSEVGGGTVGAIAMAAIALAIMVGSLRLYRIDLFVGHRAIKNALRLTLGLSTVALLMIVVGLLIAAEIYLAALVWSILTILAIKALGDVIERALLILRARLERSEKDALRTSEAESDESRNEVKDELDLGHLSEAHEKLLGILRIVSVAVAVWLIWSPALPAFNMFDSITLWQVADATDTIDGLRPITLFDLLLGIVILVFTGLIARHLPAVVQLFLAAWSHTSAGARYASGILIQYVVVAIGGYLFFATVGWDWSNLQWLVAALGVGIGFGLQEIVANLICGIIILFEQPVRVGDIITAGGAEGVVKKISARATVIQTFEGKEHLIPNKELITGQVVNWSLTENAVRVVIPVGIAYGSDVRRAMELLLEAAREVALVLPEPEPMATFEEFGDNALVLWLRCFVAEDRPRAWTELRTRINDKFSQAGIVIAFPQRDLHLDFAEALKVQLTGPQAGGEGGAGSG